MYFYNNRIFDSDKDLYYCLIDDYKKGKYESRFVPSCGEMQILGVKFIFFYVGKNGFNNNILRIYVYNGNGKPAELVKRVCFDDYCSDMNLNDALKAILKTYLLNHKYELDLSEYL